MIGTTLQGRYRLEAILGKGGMGAVYRARDEYLERIVAIKVLLATGLVDTEGRQRMLSEARAVARLTHPNIVTVHDAVEDDGAPFIVMQYVQGQSLEDYRPVSIDETLALIGQLCLALEHAHANGIIHRDVKPANVLVTSAGTAMLMDFGLARSLDKRLTTEGGLSGTLNYIAPEQALGLPVDGRADLYSLGVMLYELATGQLPFTADNPVSVLTQHLYAPVVPPRAKNEAISPALDALIVRLLSKKPEDRPSSAREVARQLAQIRQFGPELATEETAELGVLERIARGRLVGRDRELAEARSLWQQAVGGQGQMLLISGEPGIGKTRLVRELTTLAEVTGGRALVGACYPEGGTPYTPFAQIVRRALRSGQNGLALPDFVLAEMLSLAPELRLDYPEAPANPPLDPQAGRRRLFDSVTIFSQAMGQKQPLLMVLEDAHWADDGSLALLQHLARRASRQPMLIVATYREVELDQNLPLNHVLLDLNRERLAKRIKLTRLDRQTTGQLLQELFAEEITSDFQEAIYRETEGNPFFVEEVCKALVESGKLSYEQGAWRRPRMEELTIPQSVRVAIQSRLGVLDESVQDALRLAAILGREFDFDTLSAAGEWPEETLIKALEQAEKAQIIEEVSSERGATFAFAHAMFPTTLVEGLSGLRQRRLHQQVAQVIERLRPDDLPALAHHYRRAGNREKALAYLTQAGDRAREQYANEDAIRFYSQALELAPTDRERFTLINARATVHHLIASRESEWENIEEMLALADGLGDDGLRVDALLALANYYLETEHTRALEPSQQAVDLARVANDSVREARALRLMGSAYFFSRAGLAASRRALEQAVQGFLAAEMPGEAAASLHMLALVLNGLGETNASLARVAEALAFSRQVGDKAQEATSLRRLAIIHYNERRSDQALPFAQEALSLHRQLGDRAEEANALNVLGLIHGRLGQFDQSIERLRQSLNLAEAIEHHTAIQYATFNLATWLVVGERFKESWQLLEEQVSKYEDSQDDWLASGVYWNRARASLLVGDQQGAIADLEQALRISKSMPSSPFQAALLSAQARAYAESGQFDLADQKLSEAKAAGERLEDEIVRLLSLNAELAIVRLYQNRDLEEGLAAVDELLAALHERGSTDETDLLMALRIKARLLLALGQPEVALQHLDDARSLLDLPILHFRPQEFWLTRSLVLRELGRADEAGEALKIAYDILQRIADRLEGTHLQRCWLENIPDNRRILAEAKIGGLAG